MTTIKALDKPTLAAIRAAIDKALAEVSKQSGVLLSLGNGTFSETTCNWKLTCSVVGDAAVLEGGNAREAAQDIKAAADWTKVATTHTWIGIKPEWLGQTVKRRSGQDVKILGWMPARQKFPVLVLTNGQRKLLTSEEVIGIFTAAAARAPATATSA